VLAHVGHQSRQIDSQAQAILFKDAGDRKHVLNR
jgi:hypothetical protein